MSQITPILIRTEQDLRAANSECVAATSYAISVQYGAPETAAAAYAEYLKACAAVEAAEAAYNAAVKAYAVSSKCVSADIAAVFDARIAAELILCRAIISRDAARDAA